MSYEKWMYVKTHEKGGEEIIRQTDVKQPVQ